MLKPPPEDDEPAMNARVDELDGVDGLWYHVRWNRLKRSTTFR
jgi:hypothetical protein